VQRLREVPLLQPAGDIRDERRVGPQGELHMRRKLAGDVPGEQFAFGRLVLPARPHAHVVGGVDRPDAVVLEVPVRELRMIGAPGRAELFQERRQVAVDVGKRDGSMIAPAPAGKGVQDEQRLVRGALVAARPDVQPVELFEDGFPAHAQSIVRRRGSCKR